RVLIAAALWTTYERAGRELPGELEPLPAAAAETRSACTPAAAALLNELLGFTPRELLAEALERLADAGRIVAPGLRPALLDPRDEALAAVLPRVMGERGSWLCALTQRGEWLKAPAPDAARTLWQEGPHAARLAALQERRRARPAEALAWLAETWAQEK